MIDRYLLDVIQFRPIGGSSGYFFHILSPNEVLDVLPGSVYITLKGCTMCNILDIIKDSLFKVSDIII